MWDYLCTSMCWSVLGLVVGYLLGLFHATSWRNH